MPSQVLIFLLFCTTLVVPIRGEAQTCPSSEAPGWSKELRQLYADCSNSVASPNGSAIFQAGPAERLSVVSGGRLLALIGNQQLGLPSVISWSPSSTEFFLNDGNGSGLSSRLRLFHVLALTVKEEDSVDEAIAKVYRERNGCNSSSNNPNVYGVGWSADGKILYAIAQSTVNAPCGEPTRYLGFIVNTETSRINQVLAAQQFKSEYGRFLPEELR